MGSHATAGGAQSSVRHPHVALFTGWVPRLGFAERQQIGLVGEA